MTLDELRSKGYRFRVGMGCWTVYYGSEWISRRVASGKLNNINESGGTFNMLFEEMDKKAIKTAIGAAHADLVMRRVNGQKI